MSKIMPDVSIHDVNRYVEIKKSNLNIDDIAPFGIDGSIESSDEISVLFRIQYYRERSRFLEKMLLRIYAIAKALDAEYIEEFEDEIEKKDLLSVITGKCFEIMDECEEKGIPHEFVKKYGL